MQAEKLITAFEGSLSHAQGNYQMIVLASLAKTPQLNKKELSCDLMAANKGKSEAFFMSHCVFKVLKNKALITVDSDGDYSLNLSDNHTHKGINERRLILKSANKARKAYEVSHK